MAHKTKGKMPEKDYERMRRNYTYLQKNITDAHALISNLFSKSVLDEDDVTRINSAKEHGRGLECDRVQKLVDILMSERAGSFQMFLVCLQETGYSDVAIKLECEIKVALIGKTGSGKSLLGNFLLKRSLFKTSDSSTSLTTSCQLEGGTIDENTKLTVVDTPGLFDTEDTIGKTISKYLNLFALGNMDIFLIVVRADVKFTNEERDALTLILQIFGDNITHHTIVVFSNHKKKSKDISNLIAQVEKVGIVAKGSNRYVLVNYLNEGDEDAKNYDVEDVLAKIWDTSINNQGRQYSHRMFAESEKLFQDSQKLNINLQHENKLLKCEKEYYTNNNKILQKHHDQLTSEHEDLKDIDAKMTEEKSRLQQENQQLKSLLAQSQKRQEDQSPENGKLFKEKFQIQTQNDHLLTKLQEINEHKCIQLQKRDAPHTKESKKLEGEKETIKNLHENTRREEVIKDDKEKQIKLLLEKLDNQQDYYTMRSNTKCQEIQKLQDQMLEEKSTVDILKRLLTECQDSIKHLIIQNGDLQVRLTTYEQESQYTANEYIYPQLQVITLKKEKDVLVRKNGTLQSEITESPPVEQTSTKPEVEQTSTNKPVARIRPLVGQDYISGGQISGAVGIFER